MSNHVIEEAHRCLQCKNPRCSEGCPVHTPIRDAIKLLREGKITAIKVGRVYRIPKIHLLAYLSVLNRS